MHSAQASEATRDMSSRLTNLPRELEKNNKTSTFMFDYCILFCLVRQLKRMDAPLRHGGTLRARAATYSRIKIYGGVGENIIRSKDTAKILRAINIFDSIGGAPTDFQRLRRREFFDRLRRS
jgi:hypothetical protein